MTITVTDLGSNTNTSGATIALAGLTVPAGSLLVVAITEYSAAPEVLGPISDGVNSYSAPPRVSPGGARGITGIYYAENASLSGGTLTYTKTTSGAPCAIAAFYATGIALSSSLDTAVTQTGTGNSANPSVVSGTPSQAGELFVALLGQANAGGSAPAYTQDTTDGWAAPFASAAAGTGPCAAVAGGTQVNSGSGAITFAPTLGGGGGNWAGIVVAFKSAVSPLTPYNPWPQLAPILAS